MMSLRGTSKYSRSFCAFTFSNPNSAVLSPKIINNRLEVTEHRTTRPSYGSIKVAIVVAPLECQFGHL